MNDLQKKNSDILLLQTRHVDTSTTCRPSFFSCQKLSFYEDKLGDTFKVREVA